MFKKTADLLGNTDIDIVGTPQIVGSISTNSDQEIPGMRNQGTLGVKITAADATGLVHQAEHDFDSASIYTLSDLINELNSNFSFVTFSSVSGCLVISSNYQGGVSYLKLEEHSSYPSAWSYLGMYFDPHPASLSKAGDVGSSPPMPATQGNKHGTTLVARREDRLSSAVNRAMASVALNSEHTQHQISKPVGIGIQLEIDATIHAHRLYKNTSTDSYEYIWLGNSGLNDSIDQHLAGRRVFVGGLSNNSHLKQIEGSFLVKALDNRGLLSDSLDFIGVGGVSAYPTNPATANIVISSPSFDNTGAPVSGILTDNSVLYTSGNVLGVDTEVYNLAVSSFTTSSIKFSQSIPNAEVGFKVVVSGSNPSPYTNNGTYRITKILADNEIEVEFVDNNSPKILNSSPNGSNTPTARISTGGEFLHNTVVLFEPNLVFPASGKILLSLYVESSIEDNGAGFQRDTLQSRTMVRSNYNNTLGSSFKGDNPEKDSGYFIITEEHGIEVVSNVTSAGTVGSAATGPLSGTINGDWVLTAAVGNYFYEDSLGALFKVGNFWARGTRLIDFKTIQLSPFRKSDSITPGATTYYTYGETGSSISLQAGMSILSPSRAESSASGFMFLDERVSEAEGSNFRGYTHLAQITTGIGPVNLLNKTGDLTSGSDSVTLDFNPVEVGVIRSADYDGASPTIVCISTGSSAGWYSVSGWTSSSIELASTLEDGSGSFSAAATETVSIQFYTPVFATKSLAKKGSGTMEVSAAFHGNSGAAPTEESSAISLDWDGVGRGVYSNINNGHLGSTGFMIEGHIHSPADGILLDIDGETSGTDPSLRGNYGIKITTSSDFRAIEDIATYQGTSSTVPKAAVFVENSGGDSSLLLVRGTPESGYWDSSLVDIRDYSSIYGAGGILSLQGSAFSREGAHVYLVDSESTVSSPRIQAPWSDSDTLLGVPPTLYKTSSPVSVADKDLAVFPFSHESIFTLSSQDGIDIALLPGLKISAQFGNTVKTGIILGAVVDSTDLLVATDLAYSEVSALGDASFTRILSKRFKAHADLVGYAKLTSVTNSSFDSDSIMYTGISSEDYWASFEDFTDNLSSLRTWVNPTYGESGPLVIQDGEFNYQALIQHYEGSNNPPDSTIDDLYSERAGEPRAAFGNAHIFGRYQKLSTVTPGDFSRGDEWVLIHETQNSSNGVEAFYSPGHTSATASGVGPVRNYGGGILVARKNMYGYIFSLQDYQLGYGSSPSTPATDSGIDTIQLVKKIKAFSPSTPIDGSYKVRIQARANTGADFSVVLKLCTSFEGELLPVAESNVTFSPGQSGYELDEAVRTLSITRELAEDSLGAMTDPDFQSPATATSHPYDGLFLMLEFDLDSAASEQFFIKDLHVSDNRYPLHVPHSFTAGGLVSARDFYYSTPQKTSRVVSHLKAQLINRTGYSMGYGGGMYSPTASKNNFHSYEGRGVGVIQKAINSTNRAIKPMVPTEFFTVDEHAAAINIMFNGFDPLFFALSSASGAAGNRDDIVSFPGTTGFIIPIDDQLNHGDEIESIVFHTSHTPSIIKSASGDEAEGRWGVFYTQSPFENSTDVSVDGVGGELHEMYTASDSDWRQYIPLHAGFLVKLIRHSTGNAGLTKQYDEYTEPFQSPYGYSEVIESDAVVLPIPDMEEFLHMQFNSGSDNVLKEYFSTAILDLVGVVPLAQRIVDKRQYSYSISVEFWCGVREWSTPNTTTWGPNPYFGPLVLDTSTTYPFNTQTPGWTYAPIESSWDYNGSWDSTVPSIPKAKFRGAIVNVVRGKPSS